MTVQRSRIIPLINYLYFNNLGSPHQEQTRGKRNLGQSPVTVRSKQRHSQEGKKSILDLLMGLSECRLRATDKGCRDARFIPHGNGILWVQSSRSEPVLRARWWHPETQIHSTSFSMAWFDVSCSPAQI